MFVKPGHLRQIGPTHLLKSQRQKSKVLSTSGNFVRFTSAREVQAFKVQYIYDYTTKLFRQQIEVIKTNENANAYNTGQVESRH
jgi:CRISPR/Cas system CSM-associated protein Csm2 small subunit